jgi:hypothetical protein
MATYQAVEEETGFRIERPGAPPLRVSLDTGRFVVASGRRPLERFELHHVRALAGWLARWLDADRPPARTIVLPGAAEALLHARLLVPFLEGERARQLGALDPAIVAVWQAVRAVTDAPPSLVFSPALAREPFLMRDVVHHRAAAIAVAFVESHLRPGETDVSLDDDALVAALVRWRGLYSPSAREYRSLNRTLMNVPVAFPAELLCQLRRVRLERPLVDVLELAAVCTAADAFARLRNPVVRDARLRIVQHARNAEIVAAVRRIAAFTGRRLSPRRSADLLVAFRFLADFRHAHTGGLAALVEHAIRWHRLDPWLHEVVDGAGGLDAPTVLPPIGLPTDDGVRFLATIADVVDEGRRMRHCIASYAADAVAGRSFLFHVEHGGEQASIEVTRDGRIGQAAGPRNGTNAAVRWGTRRLQAWANGLVPQPARPPRAPRRRREPLPERQLSLWPA